MNYKNDLPKYIFNHIEYIFLLGLILGAFYAICDAIINHVGAFKVFFDVTSIFTLIALISIALEITTYKMLGYGDYFKHYKNSNEDIYEIGCHD